MKKKKKDCKKVIRRTLVIFSSILLFALLYWFGFSYFSMRSDSPYVAMNINFEDNEMAEKVRPSFPRKDGKYIEYDFMIIMERYVNLDDAYTIVGVPYNYIASYESRDEARFEYDLNKDKGSFDFSQVEWNEPLMITLRYRVEPDIKNFFEFSFCTLKRAYQNLFNINSSCARGNCIISRDLNVWSSEFVDGDVASKQAFFDSYDKDALIRGLFNYFITDDFGYFNGKVFKLNTEEVSYPYGTFSMESIYSDRIDPSASSTPAWVMAIASEIYNKGYDEYSGIDLLSYMKTVGSYFTEEFLQVFNDCQMAYDTVYNLRECNTTECAEIKELTYGHCKNVLEARVEIYSKVLEDYFGYVDMGSSTAFLFNLPSEMLYFNKIVDSMGLSDSKYSKADIYSYYTNAEKLNSDFPLVITNCHLLKVTEELNSYYKDSRFSSKVIPLYSSLPELTSLCDGFINDRYCNLSISKKLICADALSYSYPEVAKEVMYDIFYRYYFESPVSNKIDTYENYRVSKEFNVNPNNLPQLSEYGYLVDRTEKKMSQGLFVYTGAEMSDSYYFIYLLNKTNE